MKRTRGGERKFSIADFRFQIGDISNIKFQMSYFILGLVASHSLGALARGYGAPKNEEKPFQRFVASPTIFFPTVMEFSPNSRTPN